jgi:hypothetical protein
MARGFLKAIESGSAIAGALLLVLLIAALSGCSTLTSSWPAGKIPIWPDQRGKFELPVRDLDNYRCVQGVLVCNVYKPSAYCSCETGRLF